MRVRAHLAVITGVVLVALFASVRLLSKPTPLTVRSAHALPRVSRAKADPFAQQTRVSTLARFHVRYRDLLADNHRLVRIWTIHYLAHNGGRRIAFVLLPRWYGPRHNPAIPLVISPHGRGVPGP